MSVGVAIRRWSRPLTHIWSRITHAWGRAHARRRRGEPSHWLESLATWVGVISLTIGLFIPLLAAAAFSLLLLPFALPFLLATTHGEVFNEAPQEQPDETDWLKPWPQPEQGSQDPTHTSPVDPPPHRPASTPG